MAHNLIMPVPVSQWLPTIWTSAAHKAAQLQRHLVCQPPRAQCNLATVQYCFGSALKLLTQQFDGRHKGEQLVARVGPCATCVSLRRYVPPSLSVGLLKRAARALERARGRVAAAPGVANA